MVNISGNIGHIHLLYDYAVSVFIVYDERVLFVKDSQDQKWQAVSGHIELDEDPEGAASRLIDMQVGVDAELLGAKPEFESTGTRPLITPAYVTVDEVELPHQHISLIYFAKAQSDEVTLFDEHSVFKWVSLNELNDAVYGLTESQVFYAQQALRKQTDK